jgi:hypothetical protein
MRRAYEIAAKVFLLLGVGIIALGLWGIGFALFTPTQPPPSLNEGHGLAFALGSMSAFVGVLVASVGVVIRVGLKDAGRPSNAVEPAVAAAERLSTPLERD